MVVTPFLQPGITVPVPNNMENAEVDPKIISESSVVIAMPNDVEYYLGKKRLQKEQLAEEVDRMLEKIKHGNVVNVINEVRKLGVDKIGLVADPTCSE
jgi:biopolymer transport protein ExbD